MSIQKYHLKLLRINFVARFAVLIWAVAILVLASPCALYADEILLPLKDRFSANTTSEPTGKEVPDFQKHVSPLLGRLGCNGRACHGSFQGQGGFMLSLFGYDFDIDYKALLDEKRVAPDAPLSSLILTKPISDETHEGGKRFEQGGWEYRVLKAWIEAGAPKKSKGQSKDLQLERLIVTPTELVFDVPGKQAQINAIAVWNDGTQEDVTNLCRFFSNDSEIAKVDEQGVITGGEKGDTHVVVSYDNAVVPVNVLRPAGPPGMLQSSIASSSNLVDRLVLTKLDKLGVQPSDIASDEEFFRRVSLDVAGTLPTSVKVKEFLADSDPNKRRNVVEQLLNSPGYAALWATFLCDITGNNEEQLNNFSYIRGSQSQHWYQWVYDRVARNVPYDQIVDGIVTAVSREPNESYRSYCETMTAIANDKSGKRFAERSDMMYYWARNNQQKAEDRAVAFAYAFCGVRIQCAQCHKHPFDQWSKKDLDQFERLFDGIEARQNRVSPDAKSDFDAIVKDLGFGKDASGNKLAKAIQDKFKGNYDQTLPFPEVYIAAKKPKSNEGKKGNKGKGGKEQAATPIPTARLLGSDFVDLSTVADPRETLMAWLRERDNPYFAKAMVNRVWAHYFQVGIVNPPDDLNLANAPSNAALLDALAQGFIESGFDLKWLHRTIVNTDTYQRTWRTNATNDQDRRNFSHALLRRLPAETAYDAIKIAVSNEVTATSMCNLEIERAMTMAGASVRNRGKGDQYALSVFGRSVRESNCDCDRSSDPSLLQTVFLRNDVDVLKAMSDPKTSWLAQVAREHQWPSLQTEPNRRDKQEDPKTMMSSAADPDQKIADDLDREIRSLKVRIDRQSKNDPDGKRLADLKSQLANREAKLAAQMEKLAKSAELEDEQKGAMADAGSAANLVQAEQETMRSLIEEAYLRSLSRRPSEFELARSQTAIAQAENPTRGLSDLLWALINSKEFILNH
jgi:hypothetical protein